MSVNLWKEFANGGAYNLPFLVRVSAPDGSSSICIINDTVSLEYEGEVYLSSQFSYTPNDLSSGSFSVELAESDGIIDFLENYYELNIEVIGIYNGDEVVELGTYKHKYGTATWDGAKLEVELDQDDRGQMTFPSLIFNSYNNRGNT